MNKKLKQWVPPDLAPGNSNVVFRQGDLNYYSQYIFHTSPTLSTKKPTPLFIKDIYDLQRIEQVYLTVPILKNLYLFRNHPIHEIEVYGRCLGVYCKDDNANFMLCFIDDGSCQEHLTCKIELASPGKFSHNDLVHKVLKVQGTLRQYKSVSELHVSNYEVLGRETNLEVQFYSWKALLTYRNEILSKPWVFSNTEYVDAEDAELSRAYRGEADHEDEEHSMTKTIYNDDDNEFEVIVISDSEADEAEPCDVTQSLADLSFEFVRYCLVTNKRKLPLQEIYNHLHRQLNDVASAKLHLTDQLNATNLKSLRFEIFHGVRHELTKSNLIKCTRNLNCTIDNLSLFSKNLVKTLMKIIKNKNYIVKFNTEKYIETFASKNDGIIMDLDMLNKLIKFYVGSDVCGSYNGKWDLQGYEWVYTKDIENKGTKRQRVLR